MVKKYIKINYIDGSVGHIDTLNMTDFRVRKLIKMWEEADHVISAELETTKHNRY